MGLADAVQMSAVLRHLRKHRPSWLIDYCADEGRHSAAIGLVRNAFHYGEPRPSSSYDREIDIVLYDQFAAWQDRPNTRVSQCLHERFGMGWDPECGSYEINVTCQANSDALQYLMSYRIPSFAQCYLMTHTPPYPLGTPLIKADDGKYWPAKFKCVCIQYEGDSSQINKNLTTEQAAEICQAVIAMGRVPLLMDWRNKSPLPDGKTIHTTGRLSTSDTWGRDVQMNAAIISQCEAFVGIDSGPGKCASATSTPTLICWTGHHPALFHDPCANTTHLVPVDHRSNPLLRGNAVVAEWFEKNYAWRGYDDAEDLVSKTEAWLQEVLK